MYSGIAKIFLDKSQTGGSVGGEDLAAILAALCNMARQLRQHASISPWHATDVQNNRSVQAVPFFPIVRQEFPSKKIQSSL